MAKYKVGDKIRIVEERTKDMNLFGHMDKYLGTVMTIKTTDESSDYKMLEDNGDWLWDDSMIEGLADEEVELHPDFAEWYKNIEMRFCEEKNIKSCAIYLINQIGFGKGLEDSFERNVTQKYPELKTEMQGNKEKYTRAILDDNWTVRKEKEKMHEVVLNITVNDNRQMLMKDARQSFIEYESENKGYYTQEFTEKEIKAIDERYWSFAVPVEED